MAGLHCWRLRISWHSFLLVCARNLWISRVKSSPFPVTIVGSRSHARPNDLGVTGISRQADIGYGFGSPFRE